MSDLNSSSMRAAMVDGQLRTSDVNDPRILAAMSSVPREAFVPADRAAVAYIDRPIKLGGGRSLNPPLATGRLLVEADVRDGENVLLIGAATGYSTALLAALGARVTAVECDPALIGNLRESLAGHQTVTLVEGPLESGAPAGGPYDLIFVDGAVEQFPATLIDQLADGGRAAFALFDQGVCRLCIGLKSGGGFGVTRFADVESARLPGFARPHGFVF